MKIMTSMYTIRRGGAYDRFIMMLEAFLEKGVDVHCLSLTPIPVSHPLFHNHRLTLPPAMTRGVLAKGTVFLFFPWISLLIVWYQKIDLFVAFGSLYSFIFSLPKLIFRRPMVTLVRGDSSFTLKAGGRRSPLFWLNRVIEFVGLISSDRILTVNRVLQESISTTLGKRRRSDVRILPNNVPEVTFAEESLAVRKRYRIPKDAKVVVTAGVLNRGKRVESLIETIAAMGKSNVILLIAGDGPCRVELKELARTRGIDNQVVLTGWLPKGELWSVFRASDLFVLASESEGMPNVMLEALGCGLPCIGRDIPGIQDILQNKELMFDLNRDSFWFGVVNFFSDESFSDRIRMLCKERAQCFRFDWKEKTFQMITDGCFKQEGRILD
jgi:glycosyltransferase involved in cell wall biosynthesis